MSLLETINEPKDLKKLANGDLKTLANELREFMIESVSKTGGHLAPSLGTIELTIALHKVFDSPKDKIIWDVSHQAYTHKIICGRRTQFHTLRQFKGISGFTKRSESEHDCFDTGHASTSISAALGIAEARDLKKENFNVIAVIGDGSLGGGLAYEALNNMGYLHTDVTIILNDNKMSISPNKSAMADHLNRLSQISTSDKPRRSMGTIFESLGFKYFGPINGHDTEELIFMLQKTKEIKGPKVLHVITIKGKGYAPAEDTPTKFHGIGKFDLISGESKKSSNKNLSYSEVFGNTLCKLAETDEKLIAISAAMPSGTGLVEFAEKFPKKFYDVGIAEEHAITFAAGLATQGMKPFTVIYSSFMQRAFDEIIHDVALQNLPVKLMLDRGGLVGDDGPMHHGVFDLSYLRLIPNLVVMSARNINEFQNMVKTALDYNQGPIALRYPRGADNFEVTLEPNLKSIEIGKAELLCEGNDITLIGIGSMSEIALQAAKELEKQGIKAGVINARFVKPLDKEMILQQAKKTKKVITIEENTIEAGFGSAIVELISDNKLNEVKIERMGIPDSFIEQGSQDELKEMLGLDVETIVEKAIKFVKEK